jgi:tetrahydromethanopterin S-methyltransferase subunit B
MGDELRNLMAHLEVSLVETVNRLDETARNRLYVDVLDLEERIETLHDALALVADSIGAAAPTDAPDGSFPPTGSSQAPAAS